MSAQTAATVAKDKHSLYAAFFRDEVSNRPIIELGIETKQKKKKSRTDIKIQLLYQEEEDKSWWILTNESFTIAKAQTHFIKKIALDRRSNNVHRVQNPVSADKWKELQKLHEEQYLQTKTT